VTRQFLSHSRSNFDESVAFIHENGIQIIGVLITGPRNELLGLEGEPWIQQARVGEVTFLNWN